MKATTDLKEVLRRYSKMYWVKIKSLDQRLSGNDALIHYAAQSGATSDIEVIVRHGGNVNLQDDMGRTALHIATLARNSNLVKALLSMNADMNVKDFDGRTAVEYAQLHGMKEIEEVFRLFPRMHRSI